MDSVGAGGAFSASFLKYYAESGNVEKAMKAGALLGSYVAGQRAAVPECENSLRQKLNQIDKKGKVSLGYMNKIESYSAQVLKSGLTPLTKTIEQKIMLANKKIAEALRVEIGQGVLLLKRLRYANLIPLAITESYLPLPLCVPLAEKDLGNDSLYEYLDKEFDAKVVHVHRIIKAGISDKEDSAMLEIDEETPLQFSSTDRIGSSRVSGTAPFLLLALIHRTKCRWSNAGLLFENPAEIVGVRKTCFLGYFLNRKLTAF